MSTHGKPSLNTYAKKSGQIILYLEIFNFRTFRAEILQTFELVIWKIDDFINSFRLYLTFMGDSDKMFFESATKKYPKYQTIYTAKTFGTVYWGKGTTVCP